MGIYVILLGGHIDVESNSTCGVLATNMVQTMHFDICFLGTQAITPDWRIMTANAEKIDVKRACLQASDKVVLIADHSKFKKHKLYYIFDLWEVDTLISDYTATAEEQGLFDEHKVNFIHVQ